MERGSSSGGREYIEYMAPTTEGDSKVVGGGYYESEP